MPRSTLSRPTRRRRGRRRFRMPRVELLETRTMLAVTAQFAELSGALGVYGGDGPSQIKLEHFTHQGEHHLRIKDGEAPTDLVQIAMISGSVSSIPAADIDSIQVDGSPKADTIDLSDVSPDNGFGTAGDLGSVTVTIHGDSGPGSGEADTITGSGFDDEIRGGVGDDIIEGRNGNDEIHGGFNWDKIYGGAGNDELRGDEGEDKIYGGDGHDKIYGGDLKDKLYGDGGEDEIYGDWGDDKMYGGLGGDILEGGWGCDTMDGQDGIDTIRGQRGDDEITADNSEVDGGRVDGGPGRDRINGDFDDDPREGCQPGVEIAPTTNTTCEWDPQTPATVEVTLTGIPTEDVVLPNIFMSDPSENTADRATLTFTKDNWDTPQNVQITAVNDDDDDGDQMNLLVLAPLVSDDDDWDGNSIYPLVFITNKDDDVTANSDATGTMEDYHVDIDVLANDSDIDPKGDLTIVDYTQPAHGTVSREGNGLRYKPEENWSSPIAPDTFKYRVRADERSALSEATVFVLVAPVNDAPKAEPDGAHPDKIVTPKDTPINIDVRANDSDVDNPMSDLEVTEVFDMHDGTAVINPDQTVTFTPAAGFFGFARFDYKLSDGEKTDTARVWVRVRSKPIAQDDGAFHLP